MTTIKYPGKHDVMLGRGGESNYHSGNIAFRHMVQKYKERFRLGSRTEKNKVIDEVVGEWRDQDPAGRFVAKKTTETGEVIWYDVGNELAKKRAAKSLAEWTPHNNTSSSATSASTGKKSPGAERKKKRSRASASSESSSTDFSEFLQGQLSEVSTYTTSNKRQHRASDECSSPVNSFTVLNMATLSSMSAPPQLQHLPDPQGLLFSQQEEEEEQEEQEEEPLQDVPSESVNQQATAEEYSSSSSGNANAATSPSHPCNINSFNVLPIERSRRQIPTLSTSAPPQLQQLLEPQGLLFPQQQDATAQDYFSISAATLLNQPCNINSVNVLPLERIRLQIPTAAELAVCAFSDDDKGSDSSNNNNILLFPNKSDINFHASSSNMLPHQNPTTIGMFGGQTLFMI